MSEWQALLAGFGFYLILEGVMPFFNPQGFKRLLVTAIQMEERHLRMTGAIMLVIGMIVLFSVK